MFDSVAQALYMWYLPGVVLTMLGIIYINHIERSKTLLTVGELFLSLYIGLFGPVVLLPLVLVIVHIHSDVALIRNSKTKPKANKRKHRR